MIFVTIGTTERFDRLLRALSSLDGEELVVQCGDSTAVINGANCVDFVPYDQLVEFIRAARVVISHAGVGTILTALANGKRPIVVPRRADLGEAADDHQLELARHLAGLGLVTLVEDPDLLAGAVGGAASQLEPLELASTSLIVELRAYLESVIESPGTG